MNCCIKLVNCDRFFDEPKMLLLVHFIGSLSQTEQDGACSCVAICVTLSNVCRALNVTNALFKAAATREGRMVSEGARMGPERVIRICLLKRTSLPVFK